MKISVGVTMVTIEIDEKIPSYFDELSSERKEVC